MVLQFQLNKMVRQGVCETASVEQKPIGRSAFDDPIGAHSLAGKNL